MSSAVRSSSTSWFGLARPSCRTAVASPHTSPQPLAPIRDHRRRTRSVGRPSRVPSQPSIGSAAKRFGDPEVTRAVVDGQGLGQRAGRIDRAIDRHRPGWSIPSALEVLGERLPGGEGLDLLQSSRRLELFDDRRRARHGPTGGRRGAPGGVRVAARPAAQLERTWRRRAGRPERVAEGEGCRGTGGRRSARRTAGRRWPSTRRGGRTPRARTSPDRAGSPSPT